MKEKIYAYIKAYPHCRSRYIASTLHVWLCDIEYLSALQELYKEGKIDCEYHHDPAQMEFYNEWYVTP